VLAPVNLLDASFLYPGWATLLPVLGTVILIAFAAPGHSWIARALAWRPVAYIGRISYGTYLWHWPLIVGTVYYGVQMTDVLRGVLVLASLGLGALSYHLIEMPIRRMPVRGAGQRRLYLLFAGQFVLLLGVAVYLLGQPGKAGQGEDARLEALKSEIMNTHEGWNACWSRTGPEQFCRLGVPGERVDYLVWGDSMANSAFWAFDDFGRARGLTGRLATEPACAPLAGVGPRESCLAINRAIFDYLEAAPPMDVILVARWSFYSEGYGHWGERPGQVALLHPDGSEAAENFPAFTAALEETLERLTARHRVIVVNHIPEFPASVPKSMLRTMRFGTEPLRVTRGEFERRTGRTVEAIAAAARRHGAVHVPAHEVFCDAELCHHQKGGMPLFIDNVHLGPLGNDLLRRAVEEALAREE